jgi:catechol 2,3-dioxygenase-like lactoylglutathione lyase family enzyme
MKIDRIDHLVLTVKDIEVTIGFYTQVFGMDAISFGQGRQALTFGRQKINLHSAAVPFKPHARRPTSGSADLCLVTTEPMAEIIAHVMRSGVSIEEGPLPRTGALGRMNSIYLRDPDGNLIELSVYE